MSSSGGKGGGSGSGGSNDYYGDCAGVVCSGPVDALMAIYSDGKKVWSVPGGLAREGQPNPVALTIVGYGNAFFYWGTDDQILDTVQEKLLSARGHPTYRRQAVLVLKAYLFGREKVSAPVIEVEVRRKPRQNIVTGPAAELDADGQANPVCVIAELLTDPVFGLGRPITIFHLPSWQEVADDLHARSNESYISPVFDRSQPARALIDDIRSYYDGWFRHDAEGLIRAGRFPHNESPPTFTAANTITANDLLDEPNIDSGSWAETFNEVAVKYRDRLNTYKDAAFTLTSGYNRAVVKEPRQTQLDREFITRAEQASIVAAEHLKIVSQPRFTGKIAVRQSKAAGFPVGTIFRFEHDLLRVALVCRVVTVETSAPPEENVKISFEAERGLSALPALTGGRTDDEDAGDETEIITRAQFVQPPAEFFVGQSSLLIALAARTNAITAGCKVHFRQNDETIFQELGIQGGFAVRAQFLVDYAASTGDDDTGNLVLNIADSTVSTDLDRVTTAQSDDEVEDLTICLFAFHRENPREFEIMSVRQLSVESGVWSAQVRRGMAGTDPMTFEAGDQVWMINREEIVAFRHAAFSNASATLPGIFRIQAFSIYGEADLTECPDFTHVVSPSAPSDVTKFSIEGLRLSWSLVPGLEIAGYEIRRQSGTRRTWEDAVPMHDGLLLTSPFSLPGLPTGTNTLLIKAVDVNGMKSTDAAYIVTSLGDAAVNNVLEEWDLRAGGWVGSIVGGFVDGSGVLLAESTDYMWAVEGDPLTPIPNAPMWTNDAAYMWADDLFAPMTYEGRVTTGSALVGLRLTLVTDITGDPNSIFYREADLEDMWSATDTDLMWPDEYGEMWSVGPWKPWVGFIDVKPNGAYDFRVITGGGQVQGRLDEFTAVIDVADIYQATDNFAVADTGTRIPLTKAFSVLKVVNLTLQDMGGTAVTARVLDKDAVNGPLVKCFDAADDPVAGNVDAILQGY